MSLPAGSRVAVEKPFGENLESARALNALLAKALRRRWRVRAFRVDHFLGLAAVQNLFGMRLANQVLEPVWNSAHIEQIDIVWEETLGLEGRAAYYDQAGQLRDMIQNHLLQVLCLLTMELPDSLRDPELRQHEGCPPAVGAAARSGADPTRALHGGVGATDGTYRRTSMSPVSTLHVRSRPSPRSPSRSTTRDRAGTRFVVRTGKALMRSRMEVVARFRGHLERSIGWRHNGGYPERAAHRIGRGRRDQAATEQRCSRPAVPADSTHPHREATAVGAPPYSRVLLDVLAGGSVLSVRGDEAEEAWRIVTPLLQAWAENRVPLLEYEAGFAGPNF